LAAYGVLSHWKWPKDRRVGFGCQLFNHRRERAALVSGETDQLCLGWSADEELDALLIAENKMALAITPLLFRRVQCHGAVLRVTV